MKRLAWLLIASCFLLPGAAAMAQTTTHTSYGDVIVYKPPGKIASVALFLSGDGAPGSTSQIMARRLTQEGALVIAVSTGKFLNYLDQSDGACTDPSGELLNLARTVMSSYEVPKDDPPVVVGYSAGATIAYAVLVQSKPGSFAGGIGFGFCPDLETKKPICAGSGLAHTKNGKGPGFVYDATPSLSAPFVAMQGAGDKVCIQAETDAFIARVKGASVINLPKVGHGFKVWTYWVPQYVDAYRKMVMGKTP